MIAIREKGETVVIDKGVCLTILDIRSNQVRIGIDAPKNIPVFRKEIYESVKNSRQLTRNEG